MYKKCKHIPEWNANYEQYKENYLTDIFIKNETTYVYDMETCW